MNLLVSNLLMIVDIFFQVTVEVFDLGHSNRCKEHLTKIKLIHKLSKIIHFIRITTVIKSFFLKIKFPCVANSSWILSLTESLSWIVINFYYRISMFYKFVVNIGRIVFLTDNSFQVDL